MQPDTDTNTTICRASNNPDDIPAELVRLTVPPSARRTVNHCNLPTDALASLAFQLAPVALELDGVLPLHRNLFAHLAELDDAASRAQRFQSYLTAHFLLDDAPAQGLSPNPRIGTLDERVRWFAQYGVSEIWLYNQIERVCDVLTCAGGTVTARATFGTDDALRSSLLPGFSRSMQSKRLCSSRRSVFLLLAYQ